MDPNACVRRFCDACNDHDKAEAHAALADLYEWLARGGFRPDCGLKESGVLVLRDWLNPFGMWDEEDCNDED